MVNNGGFTLGGQTAKQLGMHMLRASQRPILPNSEDRTLSIPGRNGLWNFGADLRARLFNLECAMIKRESVSLQQAISQLAAFLIDGQGKPKLMPLIFDYQPDRVFYVQYSGSLSIDRIAGLGQFSLPLIAFDPFAESLTSSGDIILDSDILLDSDVRLDDSVSFTGPGTYEVNNWGTLTAPPVIVVTGSFTTISITTNGKTFGYSAAMSNNTLVIDCEKLTVKLSGVNVMANMTGDFIEMIAGVNSVTIGGTNLNCSVAFNFNAKYA